MEGLRFNYVCLTLLKQTFSQIGNRGIRSHHYYCTWRHFASIYVQTGEDTICDCTFDSNTYKRNRKAGGYQIRNVVSAFFLHHHILSSNVILKRKSVIFVRRFFYYVRNYECPNMSEHSETSLQPIHHKKTFPFLLSSQRIMTERCKTRRGFTASLYHQLMEGLKLFYPTEWSDAVEGRLRTSSAIKPLISMLGGKSTCLARM